MLILILSFFDGNIHSLASMFKHKVFPRLFNHRYEKETIKHLDLRHRAVSANSLIVINFLIGITTGPRPFLLLLQVSKET